MSSRETVLPTMFWSMEDIVTRKPHARKIITTTLAM
jgi:hypothetical protein